jgi:hypothetical protein
LEENSSAKRCLFISWNDFGSRLVNGKSEKTNKKKEVTSAREFPILRRHPIDLNIFRAFSKSTRVAFSAARFTIRQLGEEKKKRARQKRNGAFLLYQVLKIDYDSLEKERERARATRDEWLRSDQRNC